MTLDEKKNAGSFRQKYCCSGAKTFFLRNFLSWLNRSKCSYFKVLERIFPLELLSAFDWEKTVCLLFFLRNQIWILTKTEKKTFFVLDWSSSSIKIVFFFLKRSFCNFFENIVEKKPFFLLLELQLKTKNVLFHSG